jgi:hypothetical protein
VALVFVPALDRLQDLSRMPQGRENEVGVGTDGGGVWAVSAVGSCARVPKRRIGRPLQHTSNLGPGKPPPLGNGGWS